MVSEIETTPLEELCEKVVDCPHSTPVWTEQGVVVLRSPNIKNGRLDLSNPSFTDEVHYEERSRRARIQGGDVVITREAPMGEVCLIPDGLKCCLGQRMVLLRPSSNACHGKYLLYALQSRQVQNEIKSHDGTGSTVSNLRIPVLKNLSIPTPSLSNQKAIAHILGTLDDKIELNRKTNETLEGIAKALFKSWFVDFDPVRAKKEGRPTGLTDQIDQLFPDSFEESQLGEIPSGWKVGTIRDDIGDTFDGPHATPKESLSGNVFLGIKNMTGTSLDLSDRRLIGDEDWAKWTKRVTPRHGDIVFTYEAALGMFAVIPPHLKCCLGRRMALVRLKESGNNPYFWFHQFISDPFQRLIDERAIHGATVNRTPLTEFPDYPVIVPTRESISCFENVAKCLWERLFVAREEIQSLGLLRDALLPRLISGELRVPDAEKMLKKVGV